MITFSPLGYRYQPNMLWSRRQFIFKSSLLILPTFLLFFHELTVHSFLCQAKTCQLEFSFLRCQNLTHFLYLLNLMKSCVEIFTQCYFFYSSSFVCFRIFQVSFCILSTFPSFVLWLLWGTLWQQRAIKVFIVFIQKSFDRSSSR